jgi:predicted nucleic acid-binding protein
MTLVDSDVLISHLRGHPAATDFLLELRRRGPRPAISVVTVAEISGGMRSAERPAVWRLLASFALEPVDDLIARTAGELMRAYRRSHRAIGLADYLIGATALTRGHELATLNVRHFPMFERLQPPFAI